MSIYIKKYQVSFSSVVIVAALLTANVGRAQEDLDEQAPEMLVAQAERTVAQTGKSAKPLDELAVAMQLAKRNQFQAASAKFFQLSMSPKYEAQRMQIRYLLGLMLYQMKLYQLSTFQFISVIRDGNSRFVAKSLEKLSLAANELGDDTLLNYAISRVKVESFPAVHRDMLYYRIAEFQLRNSQMQESIESFNHIQETSPLFDKALYMKGLAYAQLGDAKKSIENYDQLLSRKQSAAVTDTTRVAALMGKARALYQNKEWSESIQAYRDVPRDTPYWHDTIFESSWAMLRSGKFRSVISNFQSLHSPYYEENYLPESLLLRSIVYLYICQYDEMDKVLLLFNRIYRAVFKDISSYLNSSKNPNQYFTDAIVAIKSAEKENFDPAKAKFAAPYMVTHKISKEGDFQRSLQYVMKLLSERKKVLALPVAWRSTGMGKYSLQTLDRRIDKARNKAGRQIRTHMIEIRSELVDLFEQEGLIRYEMLNGRKEILKKKVAGKEVKKTRIGEERSQDYYIQNGYEYWPFRGEYWLDEIGNYHYLGTSSCER